MYFPIFYLSRLLLFFLCFFFFYIKLIGDFAGGTKHSGCREKDSTAPIPSPAAEVFLYPLEIFVLAIL